MILHMINLMLIVCFNLGLNASELEVVHVGYDQGWITFLVEKDKQMHSLDATKGAVIYCTGYYCTGEE